MENNKKSWHAAVVILLLVLICLSGLAFSAKTMSSSLWIDEARSVEIGLKSFSGILTEVSKDNHPPLYYLVLSLWMKVFGISETAVRGISIFFYLVAVISIYYAGSLIYGKRHAGLISAALYAVSAIAIRHSASARMYSMVSLLEIWSIIMFYKTFLSGKTTLQKAEWLAAVNILGSFTHYWFLFVILGQLLYCVLFRVKEWKYIAGIYAASILPLFLLWGGVIYRQSTNGSMNFIVNMRPSILTVTVDDFFYGKTASVIALVILASFAALLFRLRDRRQTGTIKEAILSPFKFILEDKNIFLLLLFVVILVVPYLVSIKIVPVYIAGRYTIVTFVPFVLLLSGFAWKYASKLVFWIVLLIFIINIYINNYAFSKNFDIRSDRYRAGYLAQSVKEGDAVIFVGLSKIPTDYYLRLYKFSKNITEFSFPGDIDSKHPCWTNDHIMTPELEKEFRDKISGLKTGNIWVVGGEEPDMDKGVKRVLLEKHRLVKKLANNMERYEGKR